MENEQQPQQSSASQPSVPPTTPQPVMPAEPSVTPSGLTTPAQPVTESMVKTQTEQQTSAPFIPNTSGEVPKKGKSGLLKWVGIGAGILVVAASGLYFSGILNPAPQNADQLKGAADQTATQEATAGESQQTEQLTGITQVALNACPQGQVMDPVSNRCSCDINNNYFEMNIAGAYTSPTAGQEPSSCTTCSALSDQILSLGKSTDPADAELKTKLDILAKENNCSPCAVFDDRIAQAEQSKNWEKYFELVVEKSNDKTCGRALSTCDTLKWQLLFLNDLRDKAGKDTQTLPAMLALLQEKQQSLAAELGTNTACYSMEELCTDLKALYRTTPRTDTGTSADGTSVGSAPLLGGSNPKTADSSTQQTQETGSSQQETITPDLNSITLDQLFDREFYMLHCPVDGMQTQQTSATAPLQTQQTQQTAPVKVSRTKK